MDTQVFQPFYDMLALFKIFFTLASVGVGVLAAFYIESFFISLFMAVFFILFSYILSPIIPDLMGQVSTYIIGLGVGFATGTLVKWVKFQLWGY